MRLKQPRPSRLAAAFVVVGLALSAIGIAYLIYAGRERTLPPVTALPDHLRVEQARALLAMLTHSFLIFLAFLIGSYVMVRIGRRALDQRRQHQRSEYVDAWGSYRLTQEEVDTATARLDDDFPPDAAPPDSDPKPPEESP